MATSTPDALACLLDYLVAYPETEQTREEREQDAGEEEPCGLEHDFSECPRARDARRAVIKGNQYPDVIDEIPELTVDAVTPWTRRAASAALRYCG